MDQQNFGAFTTMDASHISHIISTLIYYISYIHTMSWYYIKHVNCVSSCLILIIIIIGKWSTARNMRAPKGYGQLGLPDKDVDNNYHLVTNEND